MGDSTHTSVAGDNRGIIAGKDIAGANLITADIEGSYNNIGTGITQIIQHVETFSPVKEQEEAIVLAQSRLAEMIKAKLEAYNEKISSAERPQNPYKNLSPYGILDAPYFFGREDAIKAVLELIHNDYRTVLKGPTGVGKSSFLRAGLMSRLLAAGHLPLYIEIPPKNDDASGPIDLVNLIKANLLGDVGAIDGLGEISLHGLLTHVSNHLGKRNLYVFIDRFGYLCEDAIRGQGLKEPFVDEFHQITTDQTLGVRWIISVREAHAAKLELLGDGIFNNTFELPELKVDEATRAIFEPAAQKGVVYEEGLIPQILSDLEPAGYSVPEKGTEGWFAPAPIQWVCHTLFEERGTEGTTITQALYEKGRGPYEQPGMSGILSSYLQQVLRQFSQEDRALAIRILRILRDPLEEEEVTRGLKSFVQAVLIRLGLKDNSIEAQQISNMLNRLIDRRLLTLGYRDTASGQKLAYGLAHDSLAQTLDQTP